MKKIIVILLVFLMIVFLQSNTTIAETQKMDITLRIGSPLILNEKNIMALDSENPNVVPVIHKDRTLVPLRAIAEHFGAEVSYDNNKREATISFSGKDYIFPIGEDSFSEKSFGKKTIVWTIDTETLIIEDRTMVPLRVISEQIFNKKVGYMDGVITIGDKEVVLTEKYLEDVNAKIGQALRVKSKEQLMALIGEQNRFFPEFRDMDEVLAPIMNEKESTDSDSGDFTTTNEQVAGVNEADIMKTDGKFIYYANSDSVKVYLANNGKPILTDEIKSKVDKEKGEVVGFSELYIDKNRLVIIGSVEGLNNWIRPVEPNFEGRSIMPYPDQHSFVYVGIYSVSEDGKLSLLKEVEVDGNILSSRKTGNTLYLLSNKYIYAYGLDSSSKLPLFKDSAVDQDYKELSIDRIMYYPYRPADNYLLITAIDIQNTEKPANIEAFLGSGRDIYMTPDSLYVVAEDYSNTLGSISNIARFSIDGLKIGYSGGGFVKGSILNQFSMDEWNGNFRIATNSWDRESTNSLYILDKDLEQIGAIENLALGERIYSVRFMKDKAYIVTFRQIDPLFVIDTSNPSAPKILGELKIPGFSNYLHPISENTLLGIGQDVDEKTGQQGGIKLSLFDVSDSARPKEIDSIILGESGSYAEVLNNHKALMVDNKRDIVGFDATLNKSSKDFVRDMFSGAVLVSIEDEKQLEMLDMIEIEGLGSSQYNESRRLLVIDDVLYYIGEDGIRAFDYGTLKEIK
ncbi:MAG: beta-propeller domain-containing protein [Gudongella sp.]|nr:beta-propeller domain-containing protein [Gudongella sp.]